MKAIPVSLLAITFALGLASGGAFAQQDGHHPDQSSEATGSAQATPEGGGEGEGGGMMSGGGMGMMKGGMKGMHGRGMGKMHGGHHGGAPSVVINIYPGAGMGMMSGGMMPGGGMGQGGMMPGGGMGMMGHGGMMPGGGMGMMDQGGMMKGEGQAATLDQQITVDQARERMIAMMQGMGSAMALGKVTELDQDLIDAELTDPSGSPAGRMIINRHSGAMMRVR